MLSEKADQKLIQSVNPATKEIIGSVAITPLDKVKDIVSQAQDAYKIWSKTPLDKRLNKIKRFMEILLERQDEVAKLITQESGKPLMESLGSEIFAVLETCQWLLDNAQDVLHDRPVRSNFLFFPGRTAYNTRVPYGVIAVISPWNYPLSIPAATMVNALAAGNTVVLKPSPKTPLIAEKLVALLQEAGFPSGSVGLVQGDRDEAKELILSDVRRIVFTGSVPGGRAIMGLAAQKLHPLTLELGGKHAAIVRADINIQDCVSSFAWCGFTNNGQACASIERMYVHRSVADKLIPAIVAEVKKLRLGNGLDANVDLGPVIDEGEMKRVKSQIEDAVAKGAKLLTGGNIREDLGGYFLEPTVLADVTPDMRVIKEECFGPILPIMTVDSDQDAIAHTNNCHLGLGTSIWTKDLKKGEELAKDIEAGMVWINDGLTSHINPDAPWGGIKDSGFGRTHSAQGLLDLTYCKYVSLESAGKRDWHFPYNATRLELMKNSLSMIHGKNIFSKLIAAIKALPGLISVRTNKG